MNLVRENISFERGIDSKRSLELGFQPVVFTGRYSWDDPRLDQYKNEKNVIASGISQNSGIYPVYLLSKKITGDKVVELFASTVDEPNPKIDDYPVWDEIIVGNYENMRGEHDFSVLKINKEKWKDFRIADLKVFSPSGDQIKVVDRSI